MTFLIDNRQTDPCYNLALEQVLFEKMLPGEICFMLWQNHNAVIVGRHQNTLEEINPGFIKENKITVVRRLSGGGAVYHDLGNLNYTFIMPASGNPGIDFVRFCEPVRYALNCLGVPAEIAGRNDMAVNGMKISGNAQYLKNGKIMHHGTILFDTNLEMLSKALKPKDKIESKAIRSKPGSVTNIRPLLKKDMNFVCFRDYLKSHLITSMNLKEIELNREDHKTAADLRERIYSQWSWNYGNSPPFTLRKTRRFEGCGKIDVFLDVGHDGIINNVAFFGDFFGNRDTAELTVILAGRRLEYNELSVLLGKIDISQYFYTLETGSFLSLLFE